MALIVTRKPSETLVAILPTGEVITIAVEKRSGNCARLKVDAPQSVQLLRGEFLTNIKKGLMADGQRMDSLSGVGSSQAMQPTQIIDPPLPCWRD